MPLNFRSKELVWTSHAHAKMAFYKLSESRVRRVLHAPKRIEEGVAPKTVAMMHPASTRFKQNEKDKRTETWSQEIWVMLQDSPQKRTIISAWRYPGVTKPRSAIALQTMRQEYDEFIAKVKNVKS